MEVYSVGEFCKYEGGGWSLLVHDNENALSNIKKVLIDHHTEELNRYTEFQNDDDDTLDWTDEIVGHQFIIDLVNKATSIDDIKNTEIPPFCHDVIRIYKLTILE